VSASASATAPAARRGTTLPSGVDPADLREEFDTVLAQVLDATCLTVPEVAPLDGVAGREGRRTGELAPVLHELQALARAHPDATW